MKKKNKRKKSNNRRKILFWVMVFIGLIATGGLLYFALRRPGEGNRLFQSSNDTHVRLPTNSSSFHQLAPNATANNSTYLYVATQNNATTKPEATASAAPDMEHRRISNEGSGITRVIKQASEAIDNLHILTKSDSGGIARMIKGEDVSFHRRFIASSNAFSKIPWDKLNELEPLTLGNLANLRGWIGSEIANIYSSNGQEFLAKLGAHTNLLDALRMVEMAEKKAESAGNQFLLGKLSEMKANIRRTLDEKIGPQEWSCQRLNTGDQSLFITNKNTLKLDEERINKIFDNGCLFVLASGKNNLDFRFNKDGLIFDARFFGHGAVFFVERTKEKDGFDGLYPLRIAVLDPDSEKISYKVLPRQSVAYPHISLKKIKEYTAGVLTSGGKLLTSQKEIDDYLGDIGTISALINEIGASSKNVFTVVLGFLMAVVPVILGIYWLCEPRQPLSEKKQNNMNEKIVQLLNKLSGIFSETEWVIDKEIDFYFKRLFVFKEGFCREFYQKTGMDANNPSVRASLRSLCLLALEELVLDKLDGKSSERLYDISANIITLKRDFRQLLLKNIGENKQEEWAKEFERKIEDKIADQYKDAIANKHAKEVQLAKQEAEQKLHEEWSALLKKVGDALANIKSLILSLNDHYKGINNKIVDVKNTHVSADCLVTQKNAAMQGFYDYEKSCDDKIKRLEKAEEDLKTLEKAIKEKEITGTYLVSCGDRLQTILEEKEKVCNELKSLDDKAEACKKAIAAFHRGREKMRKSLPDESDVSSEKKQNTREKNVVTITSQPSSANVPVSQAKPTGRPQAVIPSASKVVATTPLHEGANQITFKEQLQIARVIYNNNMRRETIVFHRNYLLQLLEQPGDWRDMDWYAAWECVLKIAEMLRAILTDLSQELGKYASLSEYRGKLDNLLEVMRNLRNYLMHDQHHFLVEKATKAKWLALFRFLSAKTKEITDRLIVATDGTNVTLSRDMNLFGIDFKVNNALIEPFTSKPEELLQKSFYMLRSYLQKIVCLDECKVDQDSYDAEIKQLAQILLLQKAGEILASMRDYERDAFKKFIDKVAKQSEFTLREGVCFNQSYSVPGFENKNKMVDVKLTFYEACRIENHRVSFQQTGKVEHQPSAKVLATFDLDYQQIADGVEFAKRLLNFMRPLTKAASAAALPEESDENSASSAAVVLSKP